MHNCDFCGVEVAVTDGAFVPGAAMSIAIEKGYLPSSCPHWAVMWQRIAAALERESVSAPLPRAAVGEEAVLVRWMSLLRTSEKNWRLCNACFSTLGPYLPPRPAHSPQPFIPVSGTSTDALEYVIPLNTSIWAIFAGYAGLLATIPFLAPFALILGGVALWHVRKHRAENMKGWGRGVFAVVMGIASPVLWTLLFLLIAYS